MEGVHITRSRRKSIELSIDDNLQIAVKAPLWVTDRAINHFIAQKADWISRQKAAKAAYLQAHPPLTEAEVEALRRRAKAVNFGIVYGISAFALAQDIGVTVAEAKAYMDRYFETYSTLRQYMTDVVAQAEQDGYVQTMMHRRRPLPELKSSNFNLREFGKRVALNMPVQGSAADIMKLAMVRVHDRLKREGLRARLLMQVHDELIAECPAEEQAQVKRILTEEMEHAAALSVPLTVDAHCGKNWLEAKG